MELFFTIIGGIIFLPLLKMFSLTNSSRVKFFIVIFLILTGLFTLKGCSRDTGNIAKVVEKNSQGSSTTVSTPADIIKGLVGTQSIGGVGSINLDSPYSDQSSTKQSTR